MNRDRQYEHSLAPRAGAYEDNCENECGDDDKHNTLLLSKKKKKSQSRMCDSGYDVIL